MADSFIKILILVIFIVWQPADLQINGLRVETDLAAEADGVAQDDQRENDGQSKDS